MTTTASAAPWPIDSRFSYALWAIGEAKASLVELAAEASSPEEREVCRAVADLQNAETALAGASYWWRRSA